MYLACLPRQPRGQGIVIVTESACVIKGLQSSPPPPDYQPRALGAIQLEAVDHQNPPMWVLPDSRGREKNWPPAHGLARPIWPGDGGLAVSLFHS